MADPVKLSGPSINQLDASDTKNLFLDPRRQSEKGPETEVVTQGTVTAQVPLQPSRLTKQGIDPNTGEKKDLREIMNENYGGDTIGGDIAIKASTYLDNSVGGIARGINDFVAGIGDFALNNIDDALTAAGIVDEKTIDRDFLKKLVNSSDYESQKVIIPYLLMYGQGERVGSTDKDSIVERYGRAAGEQIALAAPIVAMQVKLAQLTALTGSAVYQATQPAITSLSTKAAPYIDRVVAPFRSSPALATAFETGASGVAGLGMQAEEDIFGTNTGLGGLAAVLSPVYLATKIAPSMSNAFKWFGKPAVTMIDDAAVSSGLVKPGGGRAQTTLETQISLAKGSKQGEAAWQRAQEIETALTPFASEPIVLTPAEKTLDAPFIKTQKDIEVKADADFTRKNIQRKFNVLEGLSNFKTYITKGRSDPTLDAPLYIYDEATKSYTATVAKLDTEAADLSYQLDTLSHQVDGAFPLMTDKAARGNDVRQSLITAKLAAKEAAEVLATKLKINSADQLASNDALVMAQTSLKDQVLTRQGDKALSFKNLHPMVKEFLDTKLQRVSFQDWKSFSSQTSDALGKAIANKKGEDIRTLTILKGTLDNMGEAYGRTTTKFQEFQTVWRETVIEPFSNGFVNKVIAGPGGTRGYTLADEKVAGAFLTDSNSAKTYVKLFGDDPDKMRFMKNAALDAIRKAGMGPKGLNADKINAHLNVNRDVYSELGFLDDFNQSSKLVGDILTRNADLAVRTKVINGNLLNKSIAKSLNNNNPQSLFDDAIRNPTIMKELKAVAAKGSESLTPEDSLYAFRGAITDRLFRNYKGTDVFDNPAAFKQMIVDNEVALNQAFDKKHLDNIYLIADAVERVMATGQQRGGAGITDNDLITSLTAKLGTTPAGLSNRFIAVQEGRLGNRAAIAYVASRFLRQESGVRSEMIFKEMMFDPRLAADLTTTGPAPLSISSPVLRRVNTYLFNVGVEAIGAMPDVDPDATREVIFENPETNPELPNLPQVNLPKLDGRDNPYLFNQETGERYGSNTPAPPPVASQEQKQTASASELFPFDPTLAAIERRQNAKEGIMSVT